MESLRGAQTGVRGYSSTVPVVASYSNTKTAIPMESSNAAIAGFQTEPSGPILLRSRTIGTCKGNLEQRAWTSLNPRMPGSLCAEGAAYSVP